MTLIQSMPPATAPRPDAPTTWRQIADKPAGGFIKCPSDLLLLPWGLYRAGQIDFLALRTWCGLLELPERRCDRPPDQDVHYSIAELCQLLDVPRRAPVQTAVRSLEDLGLVAWSMSSIDYLPTSAALHHRALPGYQALQAQSHPWRTWVPVPRRLMRWLAREGTPGLWATAVGVLLRCLWSKQRQCVSGGRVAARWIAQGFGLAKRTVHRGLDGLQACGWVERLATSDADDAAMARRHGARTVINLQWNVPGASESEDTDEAPPKKASRGKPRPACQEVSVEHFVKHPTTLDQNLSPLPTDCDQNLSPLPPQTLPKTPGKHMSCATPSGIDLYLLQKQRPDPLPALRAPEMATDVYENLPTGVCQNTPKENKHPSTQVAEPPIVTLPPTPPASSNPAPLEDPGITFAALPCAEQDELLQAATARLLARGISAAFLIRPALLAEVYAHLALPSLAVTPGEARQAAPGGAPPRQEPSVQAAAPLAALADPAASFAALPLAEQDALLAAVTAGLLSQGMDKGLLIGPVLLAEVYAQLAPPSVIEPGAERHEAPAAALAALRSVAPAKAPAASLPPSLSDVVPTDLHDLTRLEALRQQAIRRGWLTGCAADRLNFVAAAMHARRIGAKPCALFVAVVRERRWELITQEDEDQALALLRKSDEGGKRPSVATPSATLSDDACVVRMVQQTLRQAGSDADPFVVLAQRDASWTRVRWEAALAELHALSGRPGLERLGEVLGAED